MKTLHLRYTSNFADTVKEVEAANGKVLHRLGPSSVVLALETDVSPKKLKTCLTKAPVWLEEGELAAVTAWKAKLSPKRTMRSMVVPRGEGQPWSSEGFLAPAHHDPGQIAPFKGRRRSARAARSTGTSTSLQLTDSVAVGVFLVSGFPWRLISGKLKHVSAAADGTVWGVNGKDEIYRRTGTSWQKVAGKLKQISVGSSSQVWGVNSDDNIYRRSGSSWVRVEGKLKHVSVAADGTIWGVNASDTIYQRFGSQWAKVPGKLAQISVSASGSVWGVNADKKIYRWQLLT